MLGAVRRVYPSVIGAALGRTAVTLAVVAIIAAVRWPLSYSLASQPAAASCCLEVHQGEFTLRGAACRSVRPLRGHRLAECWSPVEEAILAERQHIESLLVTLGYDAANSQRSDEGEHTARFKVLLERADPQLEERVAERLRRRFAEIPDLETPPGPARALQLPNTDRSGASRRRSGLLKSWSQRISEVMSDLPELADVETTLKKGAPEVQIVLRPGTCWRATASTSPRSPSLVRNSIQGYEATRYNCGTAGFRSWCGSPRTTVPTSTTSAS